MIPGSAPGIHFGRTNSGGYFLATGNAMPLFLSTRFSMSCRLETAGHFPETSPAPAGTAWRLGTHMRRNDDIRFGPKWTFFRKWFFPSHIEAGSSQSTVLQSPDQRCLINQSPAPHIDQIGSTLHPVEFSLAEISFGRRIQRQGQNHHIAFGQQVIYPVRRPQRVNFR